MDSIIGISKQHNNYSKKRKANSKDGKHWRMYINGSKKFRSVRISAKRAYMLKCKMFLFGKNSVNVNEISTVVCDKCRHIQEDIGQKVCDNCSY